MTTQQKAHALGRRRFMAQAARPPALAHAMRQPLDDHVQKCQAELEGNSISIYLLGFVEHARTQLLEYDVGAGL